MNIRRVLRDLNDIGATAADAAPVDDEADGYELALSAREFTNATRKVVDEKLTFSAALLRAGEVGEAQKILAEVEHDVRNEEAALLERVNEVSAKRAVNRAHVTRLRLVRMLATAMVGAGLLGVSAMGMAVAGMFDERQKGHRDEDRGRNVRLADARGSRDVKKLVIGGMKLKLTKQDLETFRRLTSGSVDALTLEKFLVADLELPRSVVDHALASVLSLSEPVQTEVKEVVSATVASAQDATTLLNEPKKKAPKIKKESTAEVNKPQEPNDGETPPPEDPEETPTAETEEDEEDEKRSKDGDGGGDGQETGLPGVNGL